jgi:hypothetical protein
MHSGVAIRNPILFYDAFREGKQTSIGRMVDEEFNALLSMSREINVKETITGTGGDIRFSYK